MKKTRKYGRLSEEDKRIILEEIRRFARGEAGPRLAWKTLEEFSGFSRTALSNHADIKEAFIGAKEMLRDRPKNREQDAKDFEELRSEIEELRREIGKYKKREALWKARWQRIAYHVRQHGMQMHLVDRPAAGKVPSERETAKILRPFDDEIPSPR